MRRSCMLFALLLSGCGLLDGPAPQEATPAARADLLLAPGDSVRVIVADEPEMSGVFSVTQQGSVHLELLGDVRVTGLTPQMLAEELRRRLAGGYLKDPQVVVMRAAPAATAAAPMTPVVGQPASGPPFSSQPLLAGGLPPASPPAAPGESPPPLQGSLDHGGNPASQFGALPPGFSPPAPVLRQSQDVGQPY